LGTVLHCIFVLSQMIRIDIRFNFSTEKKRLKK